MSAQQIIEQQVTTNPVVLYMKGTPQFPQCGFSGNRRPDHESLWCKQLSGR